MKSFFIGTIIAFIIAIITAFTASTEHIASVLGTVGLLFGIVALALSGSAVSGDRIRANYTTENEQGHNDRQIAIRTTILLGLPCLLIAFIVKYIFLF